MADFGRDAPAPKWRAFFILGGFACTVFAGPTANTSLPDYGQGAKATAAEAQKMLEQFQRAGIAGGEYFLEFDLRVLPRRGDERIFHAKLWGGHNDQGVINRIAVVDGAGEERRFLLQNGPRAAAWSFGGGKITQLAVDALFEALVPGVEITPFDLQMPFLYWPDYTVEKIVRLRGRPTQVFFFRPPPDFAKQHAGVTGVRTYLDSQYNAPVQTELIGPAGRVLKTLSLLDLKRVGDQPIVKTIDVRNEATRDKTRFQVTGAALDIELGPAIFEPGTLAEAIRPPPPERITRLDP
jgi:hypothetical protein